MAPFLRPSQPLTIKIAFYSNRNKISDLLCFNVQALRALLPKSIWMEWNN